jgi:protein-S-isoprenylcysteine O-methyltransferase Ste14
MLVVGLGWNVVFWIHVLVYRPTPSNLSIIVSSPMVVAGLLLVGWSRIKLRKMGRTAAPATKLITSGPYAITRHPWYWGWTLNLGGLSILTGGGLPLLLAGLFFSIAIYRAYGEEKALEEAYGEEWGEYCRKTAFFFKLKRRKC